MSAGTASAREPSASISAAVFSSGSGRRPQITTSAPQRAMSSATARPMPVPPPVTRATVPRWTSGRSTSVISYATGRSRNAVPRLISSLAMMTRWISEVPSQMRSTRTSRYIRSMGYARS